MPELMNLSLIGSERAEQVANKLRQYESIAPSAEDLQEAVRAAGTMASLTLFAWDAVQQVVTAGVEGGRAREIVGKAFSAVALWLTNIRIAIRIAEQFRKQVPSPLPVDELRHLENRLEHAHLSAQKLQSFVNAPPPALTQALLERIEKAGQADDSNEYLNGDVFLRRMRAGKGS